MAERKRDSVQPQWRSASAIACSLNELTADDRENGHIAGGRRPPLQKKRRVMLQGKRILICGSVLAFVFLGMTAYGQNTAGTILGTTSDQSGARLPGVTVTITQIGRAHV